MLFLRILGQAGFARELGYHVTLVTLTLNSFLLSTRGNCHGILWALIVSARLHVLNRHRQAVFQDGEGKPIKFFIQKSLSDDVKQMLGEQIIVRLVFWRWCRCGLLILNVRKWVVA
jgi:hypothetical protein